MSVNTKRTTIYKEAFDAPVSFEESFAIDYVEDYAEDFLESPGGETVFEEDLKDVTLGEMLEPMETGLGELADQLEDAEKDVEDIISEYGEEEAMSILIPGSDLSSDDLKEDEEERETDYANDRDLTKFMAHVSDLYPAQIPRHDGTSTVGCERAISFLDRLNGDISRAIREDHDNVLDISKLEDVRVNIMRDVLVLKDHLGKLKKQIKDSHGNKESKASTVPDWKSPSGRTISYAQLREKEDLEKKASTPNNIVIAVSPFERAISGMMINAHVSAGHPMEEVYASLKKKYDLTDREELSIMQLCMDSGFHIFKDRGAYSAEKTDDNSKQGVDFVRNYFA
tara:strand:- start:117 stop:1136 length:1020 start_codon:yes stop_codon:yes gene_type:complete